jgi:glyoxylase-like metal-dependent hydrolase (beta-lactamase superfamily II)
MTLGLTEVAPGVYRLFTRYTNWYPLESGGRLTVLDAWLPGDWREFSSALARLGHSPGDIDAVLVTHHHPDHAGNAERLRSTGARVLAHPADSPYLRGEKLSREDLGALVAVGHRTFGRLGREADGDQRERDGAGVGEHVRSVRQQRERVNEGADDDLEDHEADDERSASVSLPRSALAETPWAWPA